MAKLSPHAHDVMRRANELGYFPTPAQAKEISLRSAERFGQMRADGRVAPRGAIPPDVGAECDDWAIRAVMEEGKAGQLVAETIAGLADDALVDRVAALIRRAAGKQLRVRVEEV